MKTKDQLLLEQAYQRIYENESVLIPRRSAEERQKNYKIASNKQIQEYIKNGSKGNLDLNNTPITSLPKGLTVGGGLYLSGTPLSKQYTKEQIKQMCPGVLGGIYT